MPASENQALQRAAPARSALVVVNGSKGAAALDQIEEALSAHGLAVEAVCCETAATTDEIVRGRGASFGCIVIGGGDGTISHAASALLAAERPLGIVPLGTANDLARTLEIPTDIAGAAAVVAAGHRRAVDVGLANDRPFFNVASVGLAAEVARRHDGRRKKVLKRLSYPVSWLDAYRSLRPFHATITCDGRSMSLRCMMIAVANGRNYGGGMVVAEDARIDDGRLDGYCVRPADWWYLLALFPALRRGRLHDRGAAETISGTNIRIETHRRLPVDIDGDLVGHTPLTVGVLPQALEVFCPEPQEGRRP